MRSGIKKVTIEYERGKRAVFHVAPRGVNSVYLFETRPRLEISVDYIIPQKKVPKWKLRSTRKPR